MSKALFEVGDTITRSGEKLECVSVSAYEAKPGKLSQFAYEFKHQSDMVKLREANRQHAAEEAERLQQEETERLEADAEQQEKDRKAAEKLQADEHKRLDHKHESIPEPTDDQPQTAEKAE